MEAEWKRSFQGIKWCQPNQGISISDIGTCLCVAWNCLCFYLRFEVADDSAEV
jgi:hypothetical protein